MKDSTDLLKAARLLVDYVESHYGDTDADINQYARSLNAEIALFDNQRVAECNDSWLRG